MLDDHGPGPSLPPADLIVDRDARLTPAELLSLLPPGRTPHPGFDPPAPWDLSGYVCWGPVPDAATAAGALFAAARGAALVAAPVDRGVAPGFVDDLQRLAAATGRGLIEPDRVTPPRPVADPTVAALLEALADGLTVPAAARRCAVSLRTAHRRLAEARAAFDLPTTGALVAHSRHGRASGR